MDYQLELISACKKGDLNRVKYLVEEERVNIHSGEEEALTWSSRCGHLEVVKYLVGKGANINVEHYYCLGHSFDYNYLIDSDTIIIDASCFHHFEVVKYLLDHGANKRSIRDERTLKYLKWIDKIRERKAIIIQRWWRG